MLVQAPPRNPRRAFYALLALAFTSGLAWLAFFKIRGLSPFEMRLLHVGLFGTWSYSLLASLQSASPWRLKLWPAYALLCTVAVFSELIQIFTPGHDPEWKGFIASMLGVVLGREIHLRTSQP